MGFTLSTIIGAYKHNKYRDWLVYYSTTLF